MITKGHVRFCENIFLENVFTICICVVLKIRFKLSTYIIYTIQCILVVKNLIKLYIQYGMFPFSIIFQLINLVYVCISYLSF